MMGVLYLAASYAAFYYLGGLLMRLVMVQPVYEGSTVRCCFASTVALSFSLFSAVLVDMAETSLLLYTAGGESTRASTSTSTATALLFSFLHLLLYPFPRVSARAFTWLLLLLLGTVLIACPCALAQTVFSHMRRSRYRRCRIGDSYRGAVDGGGPGSDLPATQDDLYRAPPTRPSSSLLQRFRVWWGWRRWGLLFLLVLLLLAARTWGLVHTGRVGLSMAQQTLAATGRRVHTLLQHRTAMLLVPGEICGAALAPSARGKDAPSGVPSEPYGGVEERRAHVLEQSSGACDHLRSTGSSSAPGEDLGLTVSAVASRVATVGVAMIGLLSGYAAVTSPWIYLSPYIYWRGREEQLRTALRLFNKKLCYIVNGYGDTQRQIAALQYAVMHEEWFSPLLFSAAPTGATRGPTRMPLMNHVTERAVRGTDRDPLYSQDAEEHQRGWPAPIQTNAVPRAPQRVSAGGAGWLRRTIQSAARAVVDVATGDATRRAAALLPLSGSSACSPAMSKQRAISRIGILRSESAALRYLSFSLYLQLHEVENMLGEAQRGVGWVGRWYAALGVMMALYSFIKLLLTVVSLWFFRAATHDPVTQAVTFLENAFILRRRSAHGDATFSVTAVEVSTRVMLGIALLVNGWMVLSSIRGALLALFHLTMSFSGSAVSRPEMIAGALSMMMGVYFLGQLVLLRASLPAAELAPQNNFSPLPFNAAASASTAPNVLLVVLGSLPYYYYQRLNDWCFLVGSGAAIVVRSLVLRDAAASVVRTASGGEVR